MARPARRPGKLPAEATSFIGRRRELGEVRRKLSAGRLVTLAGPGGVGKTRLAIRAATELTRGFPDGAWFVELADVQDPGLVGHAVMAALDLRDQAATQPLPLLLSYLRDKRLLLVLDNCEHLLAVAAALLAEVLKAAPEVRVVATSREPLSVPGEHVVPVPPLDLPAADPAVPLARLRQNEAVMLFAERAAAVSGSFEVTDANQFAVADLCRRLDGLPLAIELAAVRTRVLTPRQILDRLSDRFALLTGGGRAALPRHQTLRTTIDWSHDLLTAAEQRLLRRLCVFAGRFTIDDVEGACFFDDPPGTGTPATVSPPALDLLSSLVDKSLVDREDVRDTACYRLHETMREYAGIKLRQAGEEAAALLRCAQYYRDSVRRSLPEARYHLVEWLDWMDLEIDNMRAVLHRSVAGGQSQIGLDLACCIGWYWVTRATSEGVRWLDQLLPAAGHDPPVPPVLAYFMRGFLAVLQSDPAAARPALDRAATAARRTGLAYWESQSLSLASIAAEMAGDHAAARHLLDVAEAVATDPDDYPQAIALLQARSVAGLFAGDLEATRSASSDGARLSRRVGDLYALEMMLANLGLVWLASGDLDESKPLLSQALRIARQIDDRVAQYVLLDALGCHAAGTGQARLAARLLGAAQAVQTSVGARVLPYVVPAVTRAEESARATLGTHAFQAEYEAGQRLSREAVIALALGEPDPASAQADQRPPSPLGKREAQVAELVAEGLSNRQIGTRLLISEHTVDTHIRNILTKLGVNNRAQIAAWMSTQD
ncbi:MAG: LuxR family transcriptional regulator [Micromonosporaceae bacterium]|nr:LuxR family transcriptional regulator [Micromonosporaceae bacterium]